MTFCLGLSRIAFVLLIIQTRVPTQLPNAQRTPLQSCSSREYFWLPFSRHSSGRRNLVAHPLYAQTGCNCFYESCHNSRGVLPGDGPIRLSAPEGAIAIARQPKPACPLPLAILAGFLFLRSVFMLLFLLIPLPALLPLYLFGHVIRGPAPRSSWRLSALIIGSRGRRHPQAQALGPATPCLGIQFVFFVERPW